MALKSELQVCPEKLKVSPRARALDEKAGFFPTPIHGDTFKEHVKRYVTKQMEALKRRPNLKEWKIKIDTDCIENGVCERSNDASIPTLFHFSSCAMCGVEKEVIRPIIKFGSHLTHKFRVNKIHAGTIVVR